MKLTLTLPEGFTYITERCWADLQQQALDQLRNELAGRTCALCHQALIGQPNLKPTVARNTWVHDGCLSDYAYDAIQSEELTR